MIISNTENNRNHRVAKLALEINLNFQNPPIFYFIFNKFFRIRILNTFWIKKYFILFIVYASEVLKNNSSRQKIGNMATLQIQSAARLPNFFVLIFSELLWCLKNRLKLNKSQIFNFKIMNIVTLYKKAFIFSWK